MASRLQVLPSTVTICSTLQLDRLTLWAVSPARVACHMAMHVMCGLTCGPVNVVSSFRYVEMCVRLYIPTST